MEEDFLRKAISIIRKVHSRAPLRRICSEILKGAVENSQSDYGSFVRLDDKGARLKIAATSGRPWTTERSELELKVGDGITGQVAKTGKTYCSDDVTRDPHYICFLKEVASELAIPVKVDGEVWGIINLDSDKKAHYDASCILRMELLAEMVASAIEFRVQMDRERELSKSLIEAEKLSTMGYLVAGIAHEVNNPLASILGCAELLIDSKDVQECEKAVEVIVSQARRAGDIVKQLLAFSRRDTEEEWETLSIEELLQEVEDLVVPSLRLAGVRLKVLPVSESLSARINRVQIQQILVNLVTNAEHEILGEGTRDGIVRISAQKVADFVEISVSDNGPGLLPGVEGQLFEPFFTTKEKG
ncbi:MAG: histidine kinase dimerization/phospho-acceptor domain-containing protein, partial [Verrucomicrobiota bacterium]